MNTTLDTLRAQRRGVYDQAKALADTAAAANRAFTDDEQAVWQALSAQLDALDARIGAERRAADTDAAFASLAAQPVAPASGHRSDQDTELRGLAQSGGAVTYPFTGTEFRVNLTTLTPAAGGATVPTSFLDRLVAHMIETSPVLGMATVITTTGGEDLQVPTTTAHSTATLVAENATIGDSDPTFAQVTLAAFKYGYLTGVTNELLADGGVDLAGYLGRQAGVALGNAFGAHATVGTGTGQPRGYTLDTTLGVTGGVGLPPTADNLIDLFFSVIPPYRNAAGAAWAMNDATLAQVRKLKDPTSGEFLIGPLGTVGGDFQLLGKPIVVDPFMPDVATGAVSVVFGDFGQLYVRMAGGVRFEASRDFAWDTDRTTYRALLRADSRLVDTTGALKHYTSG